MRGEEVEAKGSETGWAVVEVGAAGARRRPLAFLCPRVTEVRRLQPWRRALAFAAGGPLCLLGVLLIPTPFPGAVPFTAGLAMLSGHYRPARRLAIRIQWTARRVRLARETRGVLSLPGTPKILPPAPPIAIATPAEAAALAETAPRAETEAA